MSHSIKLQDETHTTLDQLRGKGETYSQAVDRLLDLWRIIRGVEPVLRGSYVYHEWKQRRAQEAAAVDGSGDSPTLPHVLE
jgi:hypothetical protein